VPAEAATVTAACHGVTVGYGQQVALRDVTLELPAGSVIGLVGPNGAGKTTLLRTLLGVLRPIAGAVEAPDSVGYMPQLGPGAWDFPLTAMDVTLQGGYRRVGWLRRPGSGEHSRARRALAAVGMDGLAGRQIGRLSGGQRQRVLLARALMQESPLLLLDEPLSGADAVTEAAFVDALAELRAEGRSVVVSTHDLGWAAMQCDLLCLLSGRVVGYGAPAEVLDAERLAEAYGGAVLDLGGIRILAPEGHHSH